MRVSYFILLLFAVAAVQFALPGRESVQAFAQQKVTDTKLEKEHRVASRKRIKISPEESARRRELVEDAIERLEKDGVTMNDIEDYFRDADLLMDICRQECIEER